MRGVRTRYSKVVDTAAALKAHDARRRGNSHADIHNRDGNWNIKPVSDDEAGHGGNLVHLEINAVISGDNVVGEDEITRLLLVMEYGAEIAQIDAVHLVKVEVLVADPDK